jgi:hypothetical protein
VDKRAHRRSPAQTSRREFAKAMGMLAASSLLPSAGQAAAPEPRGGVAEALTQIVRARYGQHLSEEQLKDIEQNIRKDLLLAEFMKRTKLKNSDEPSFVFRADLP